MRVEEASLLPPPVEAPGVVFSLICATVDRTQELEALIRSLEAQTFDAFELIVVDQNEDERVPALLERLRPPFRCRRLRAPRRGACLARNLGAREAGGTWLGFPDDDCVYEADLLATLQRSIESQRPIAVSGNVICEDGRPIVRTPRAARPVDTTNAFRLGTESCLFVEAAAFLAEGGFDEQFGPGAAYPATEGAELLFRLLKSGRGPCWFEPAVRCGHPRKDGPVDAWLLNRTRAYAFGTGATARRHARVWQFAWFVAKSLLAWPLVSGPGRRVYAQRALGLIEGFRAYGRSEVRRP